jgi:GTP cyclohydrolase I
MIFDKDNMEQIEKAFKIVYTYKDEAKEANSAANETMKGLAEDLAKDGDVKTMKKVLRKAYREWQDRIKGDDSTDDAVALVYSINEKEE